MIGETHCSGIGAPETAAPEIDWRLGSEVEAFPRAVLGFRFGYRDARAGPARRLLWGDFTTLRMRHYRRFGAPRSDIIVAGTPCQSFSVAGRRRGLADPRGNLTMAFVRHVHAVANAARHAGKPQPAVLWENVPGVLSDRSNAFGCFLGALVGADDAFAPPDGGRWPGAGMVAGPLARAAWRILDAQHFGVPQRRRRVFVVVDTGNGLDPAEVLFERKGVCGDSAAGGEARKDVAGTLATRSSGGGGLGTDFELGGGLAVDQMSVDSIQAVGGDDNQAQAGQLIASHDPACTLTARERKGALPEADLSTVIAHTLRGEGFDASEDGTGRGTPLVPWAIQERAVSDNPGAGPQGAGFQAGVAYTLEARQTPQAVAGAVAVNLRGRDGGSVPETDDKASLGAASGGSSRSYIAFSCKDHGADAGEIAPTLRAGGHANSHANAGVMPAVAFDTTQVTSAANRSNPKPGDPCHPLASGAHAPALAHDYAVRRLTPDECARLQGFPDGHARIPWRGKPADQCPDGPQYMGYGNSMAVPVVRWLLRRMTAAMAEARRESEAA